MAEAQRTISEFDRSLATAQSNADALRIDLDSMRDSLSDSPDEAEVGSAFPKMDTSASSAAMADIELRTNVADTTDADRSTATTKVGTKSVGEVRVPASIGATEASASIRDLASPTKPSALFERSSEIGRTAAEPTGTDGSTSTWKSNGSAGTSPATPAVAGSAGSSKPSISARPLSSKPNSTTTSAFTPAGAGSAGSLGSSAASKTPLSKYSGDPVKGSAPEPKKQSWLSKKVDDLLT